MNYRRNPFVEIPDTVYHGTSFENLINIMEYGGLSPGRGTSPHHTKTVDALFYINSIEGALAYASGQKVILEISSEGLDLQPDWDDADPLISTDLMFLSEEVDFDLELGNPIPDELVDEVTDCIELRDVFGMNERAEPFSISVSEFNGISYLTAEPYVCFGVNSSATNYAPELYDDVNLSFSDGDPCLLCKQYLSKEDLDISKIKYIWLTQESIKDLRIPEYLIKVVEKLNDYSEVVVEDDTPIEDLTYADMEKVSFKEITFYAVDPLELRQFLHGGQLFFWR